MKIKVEVDLGNLVSELDGADLDNMFKSELRYAIKSRLQEIATKEAKKATDKWIKEEFLSSDGGVMIKDGVVYIPLVRKDLING